VEARLLQRQKAVLASIASAISLEQPQLPGFDAMLLAWRRATAAAALSFLDDITLRFFISSEQGAGRGVEAPRS
jgi:hypothetical protein